MTHEAALPREDVLARKIREGDWEYAALLALLRLVDATHRLPPGLHRRRPCAALQ